LFVIACNLFDLLFVYMARASTTAVLVRVLTGAVPEFLGVGRRYEK
jgi:hypothetical protein